MTYSNAADTGWAPVVIVVSELASRGCYQWDDVIAVVAKGKIIPKPQDASDLVSITLSWTYASFKSPNMETTYCHC